MTEFVYGYDAEYEAFVAARENGHLFQSCLWAGVKPAWKWVGIKAREGGRLRGVLSLLIRRVPGTPFSVAYAPRGPVCPRDDGAVLTELTQAAREVGRKNRCYVLRIDPDVPAGDEQFTALMTSLGYRLLPEARDFGNIQPQFVARLALAGKTQQEVFAGFHSKCRYNVGLALRRGVTVRLCRQEALADFTRIMEITGQRDGFQTRPRSYFETMLRALGDHARLYMAYYEGTPLAGILCAVYGGRMWYLYGASSNDHREVMPNYLLQWIAIQDAMTLGCRVYDFRGISGSTEDPADPLAGLWRFKSGFGAERVRLCGEFIDPLMPRVNRAMERLLPLGRRAVMALSERVGRK